MMNFRSIGWSALPLVLFAGSALLSAVVVAVLSRKKLDPLTSSFLLVILLQGLWSLLLVLEILSPTLEGKLCWDNAQYPLSLGLGSAFFMFARVFSGRTGRPRAARLTILILPAIIGGALAFTDQLHGLVRGGAYIDWSVPFGELVYGFTSLDYILFVWQYGLSLAAIGTLAAARKSARGTERLRYALVIAGFIIPLAGIIPSLLDVRVMGRRDVAPMWFMLCDIVIFIALFRFRLFDIVPLARRILVERIGDPILVMDADRMILDYNRAFRRLAGEVAGTLRGRDLARAVAAWPAESREILDGLVASFSSSEHPGTIDIPSGAALRRFKVVAYPVAAGGAESADEGCATVVFKDVTELAEAEKKLRDWNGELEGRVEARTHDLRLEVARRTAAEEELRRLNSRIIASQHEILVTLSELVENRSPETAHHVLRVGEYARVLAMALGLSTETVDLIAQSAPLHDVGKIAIPDSILNKAGRLTDAEMTIMKRHSEVGYRILAHSDRSVMRAAAVIAIEHHERWDGSGYPSGKSGESISISGRIVCVCDVIDALATERPYKPVWKFPRIVDYMVSESGRMFEPRLIELFLANKDRFKGIAERFPDEPGSVHS